MNNWLKIGLPILIAVLLVVASVGITLATTGGDNLTQATPSYRIGDTGNVQYAYGPRYGGMHGWCWDDDD